MASPQFSFFDSPTHSQKNLYRLRIVVWLITICAGFVQAWASRFWVSPDGNSYLDIASAYLHSDWSNAINAYWSPLFSWLLALSFGVFRPSPFWESTVVHLLNFAGLLFSICSFEFFFRAFMRLRSQCHSLRRSKETLSEVGWWVLGYALFLSASLLVLSVVNTTPDVWVAVFTYFVAGLILSIAANGGDSRLFVALGLALGLAYLTKTFYFPLSFIFLASAWLATGNPRRALKQVVLGSLVFGLIAGPWVLALSRAKHRFTFGDVGKLAFAIFYDQLQQPYFWQGENGSGTPAHAVRQLMVRPPVYEFRTPVAGSYPPAFDPSYWMEGAQPHLRLLPILRVLRQSGGTFFQIWTIQIEFGLAALILFFLKGEKSHWLLLERRQFYLWLPPLIACFNYFIVLVEPRYVAPFVLLLWVAAFASLLGGNSQLPQRFVFAIVLAVVVVTCLRLAKSTVSDLGAVLAGQKNVNWQAAEELRKLGAQPGDRVAGLSRVAESHWARLAGVKIVAEIPVGGDNIFWAASPIEKQEVFKALASTGAKFVVTESVPASAQAEGWIPLSDSGFYAYRLPSVLPTNR